MTESSLPEDVPLPAAERALPGCPVCGYSLQGAMGIQVVCPECGQCIDLDRLARAHWAGAWYRTPGLNTVFVPLLAPFFWLLGLTAVTWEWLAQESYVALAPMLLTGIFVLLWAFLLQWSIRRIGGAQAVGLVALGHLILAASIFGAGWALSLSLGAMDAALHGAWVRSGMYAGGFALAIGVLALCHRGERWIAGRCLRRHLVRKACVLADSGTLGKPQ